MKLTKERFLKQLDALEAHSLGNAVQAQEQGNTAKKDRCVDALAAVMVARAVQKVGA